MNILQKLAYCLVLLQGCSSTPSTQFYSLEAIATFSNEKIATDKKPLIGITQISLPSLLERKQIVTRNPNGQLNVAEQHQWAALLKQNMTEVLANNLAVQQPHFWFKAYPWSLLGKVDYRLVIDVTRLDITLGQLIAFSVDWTLLDENTHTIVQRNVVNLTQSLSDESYAVAVSGMNKLLMQLSEKLITVIDLNQKISLQ